MSAWANRVVNGEVTAGQTIQRYQPGRRFTAAIDEIQTHCPNDAESSRFIDLEISGNTIKATLKIDALLSDKQFLEALRKVIMPDPTYDNNAMVAENGKWVCGPVRLL